MSIASQIARIRSDIDNAYDACAAKGATMPAIENSANLADAIESIHADTVLLTEKAVNLIDYDGTLLYSYTAEEAAALSALPSTAGTHSRLLFDGWNWSLAQIKSYLSAYPEAVLTVGAMYRYAYAEDRFYIRIPNKLNLTFSLKTVVNYGTAEIDWGDGSSSTAPGGASTVSHTYAPSRYPAEYVIRVTPSSGATVKWKNNVLGSNVQNRNMLTKAEFGIGVLDDSAFYGCNALESVVISGSVATNTIPQDIVRECCALKTVVIASTITDLCPSMFSRCYQLQAVVIPTGVTILKDFNFAYCRGLRSASIPNSVTDIGTSTFYDCKSLRSVAIPGSVTVIGNGTFNNCVSLRSAVLPASLTAVGSNVFGGCELLQSAPIPSSLTSVANSMFQACGSLTSVALPQTITTIDNNAFDGCTIMKTVTIPGSVTEIKVYSFRDNTNLNLFDLTAFSGSDIPVLENTNAFNNLPNSARFVFSSQAALDAFAAATNWSSFASKFIVKDW